MIERNARSQSQLIEDLLDVSRIVHGRLRLTVAPVLFNIYLSFMTGRLRLQAMEKGKDQRSP